MICRPWTIPELRRAAALQLDGRSASEIGAQLGRSRNAVLAALMRARADGTIPQAQGLIGRHKTWQRRRRVARTLRATGHTYREIGERLGVSLTHAFELTKMAPAAHENYQGFGG
jgi:DNA-binding CsgD family transcriptional regulator